MERDGQGKTVEQPVEQPAWNWSERSRGEKRRVCMDGVGCMKMLILTWIARRLGFHQFLSEEEIGN